MGIVHIETEDLSTQEAAEDLAQAILRNYHPAGYGTDVKVVQTEGGFRVKGYRYDSCD